jgi:predicted nucleotidyltransferase
MARLEPYGLQGLLVFGSVALGTQGPQSDLDVVVDLDPARHGLFDLAGVGAVLEDLLGCPVDVVAPRFLAAPLPDGLIRAAVEL